MTDVFISYARGDESIVQAFAKCVTESGLSVWWDRKLIPGDRFDEEIERKIEEARNVVVLWSKHSVGSRWVRAEADVAFEHRKLRPAQIDNCRLPMEFRRVQTEQLVGWTGDATDKNLLQFLSMLHDPSPNPLPDGSGWDVGPAKFGWASVAVSARRGPLVHTIEYRNNVSNEVICVDGVEVCSAGSVTKQHPIFQFYLQDRPHTSICLLEPVYSALGRLVTARLGGVKLTIDASPPTLLMR